MSHRRGRNLFLCLAVLVASALPIAFFTLDWIEDVDSTLAVSASLDVLEPGEVAAVDSQSSALPVLEATTTESRLAGSRTLRTVRHQESVGVAPVSIESAARPNEALENTMPLLAGRVLGLDGESIVDARVMIARPGGQWSDPSTVVLITDSEGRFALPVSDEGPWAIHASHPSWQVSEVESFRAELNAEARIVMAPGSRLVGRVTTTAGSPIENASITLLPTSATQLFDLERAAASDAEGAFELAGLEAGTARLKIEAAGYAIRTEEVRLRESETEVVLVLTLAQPLSGQIVDEQGAALAGAIVQAIGAQGPQSTTTAPDGSFLFEGVGDDSLEIRALASGYAPLTVAEVSPADSPITWTLQSASPATGRVRDAATGAPVAGARIVLSHGAQQWKASSDVDGQFRTAGLPRGAYRVRIQAEGFQIREIEASLPVPAGLELELKRGAALDGQVLDAAGQPLAGAWVRLITAGAEVEAPRLTIRSKNVSVAASTQTDEAGRFEIQGLSDGEYWAVAAHRDYAQNRGERVLVTNGQAGASVQCRLQIGASLRGQVFGEAGPVKFGYVRITDDQGETVRRLALDDQGRYAAAGLSAGTYRLLAEKVDPELEPVTVDLSARSETTRNIGR